MPPFGQFFTVVKFLYAVLEWINNAMRFFGEPWHYWTYVAVFTFIGIIITIVYKTSSALLGIALRGMWIAIQCFLVANILAFIVFCARQRMV
ncbi:hypothetical protein FIE12Z_7339 [Fusarium flagelliforme]|uniref:Uncharacterized protein n=1 Tax=Fusarium flagelliforme TaxID=2675880 RepID=A0A395MKE9_9HYPO|nr:hypothetical protein FIE12Z_7339 [Fusarium flagelliforme]